MSKLHELLAVETSVKQQADAKRTDLTATFQNKRHLFTKKITSYSPFVETEVDKPMEETESDIQTSVMKELGWISDGLGKSMDVGFQIDSANQLAKADVVLEGGEILLKNVPATFLLQLEKRLKDVLDLVKIVPTLDPAKGFAPDDQQGKGVYAARPIVRYRAKKTPRSFVKYDATDKHPAQVEFYHEDVPTGEIKVQEWSSLITPVMKADILDRVEELTRAVKKARAKANEMDIDVQSKKVGKSIFEYILAPLQAPTLNAK